jgi:hypothetical protein
VTAVCAIHQPNFFPWLGYFDKIRRADIFVFMDDVTYPKSGSGSGTWINRVKLAIQGDAQWVTCPVRRVHGKQNICNVVIDDRQPWRNKLLKTLHANYRRAPGYESAMALLEPLIQNEIDILADFNIHAISTLARKLSVGARFLRQSELAVEGTATELLIALTKAVGADTYLSGGGASGYQEDALFAVHGIALQYQNFMPTLYGPEQRWLPGLSVIDYLMWNSEIHNGKAA